MINDIFEFMISSGYKFVEWITRPVNLIMKAGFFLVFIGFGGSAWNSIEAKHISKNGETTKIAIRNEQGEIANNILLLAGGIGLLLILGEVIYITKRRKKKLNIAIEHIAFRDKLASPLSKNINKLEGRSDILPIDVSNCYSGYSVSNPELALTMTLIALQQTLPSKIKEAGTNDITIHYGGTPPVPLGFMAGAILGDTYKIKIWDYSRDKGDWYSISGNKSGGNKPEIKLDNYKPQADVAIIMDISYPINISDVAVQITDMPYILISMLEKKHDNMSNNNKLIEFQSDFRELLKKLNHDGVETVHIFCAAQASFNFSMGRQINRNHPRCIVYEYDRTHPLKYPWGILLNDQSGLPPSIIVAKEIN